MEKKMTLAEAIEIWKTFREKVSRESLDDDASHKLFHEIVETVSQAVKNGEITYKEFHTLIEKR